jgi:hypothetical protein
MDMTWLMELAASLSCTSWAVNQLSLGAVSCQSAAKRTVKRVTEPFHEVMLRLQQLKLVPAWPGTNHGVCLNWHINGRCHDNCHRQTLHTDLPAETLKGMITFVKTCCTAHSKNSFKGNKR